MKTLLTLCIVQKDGQVLLGYKKRGFGVGLWNGFGGKLEAGESVEEATFREVEEESGVTPVSIDPRGVLLFTFASEPEKTLEVHIFSCHEFTGEPDESEEMRPQWFAESEIPYNHMWPDDQHWLPLLLAGKNFTGNFHFDQPASQANKSTILSYSLNESLSK